MGGRSRFPERKRLAFRAADLAMQRAMHSDSSRMRSAGAPLSPSRHHIWLIPYEPDRSAALDGQAERLDSLDRWRLSGAISACTTRGSMGSQMSKPKPCAASVNSLRSQQRVAVNTDPDIYAHIHCAQFWWYAAPADRV
jgi:hypothetical protein